MVCVRWGMGGQVSERQLELLFGDGRHPDAVLIERGLLDVGVDGATARRLTVLEQPTAEIEVRVTFPSTPSPAAWCCGASGGAVRSDEGLQCFLRVGKAEVPQPVCGRADEPGVPVAARSPNSCCCAAVRSA